LFCQRQNKDKQKIGYVIADPGINRIMQVLTSGQPQMQFSSPEGAKSCCQGRETLDRRARVDLRQPRIGGRRVPPLRGSAQRAAAWIPGLTPWAIHFRPAGAEVDHPATIHVAADASCCECLGYRKLTIRHGMAG
jgi:hypothetical protein